MSGFARAVRGACSASPDNYALSEYLERASLPQGGCRSSTFPKDCCSPLRFLQPPFRRQKGGFTAREFWPFFQSSKGQPTPALASSGSGSNHRPRLPVRMCACAESARTRHAELATDEQWCDCQPVPAVAVHCGRPIQITAIGCTAHGKGTLNCATHGSLQLSACPFRAVKPFTGIWPALQVPGSDSRATSVSAWPARCRVDPTLRPHAQARGQERGRTLWRTV